MIPIPHDLQIELNDDPEALAAFLAMPPSHQGEFIDWVISARSPETRLRRVEETARMVRAGGNPGVPFDE